MEEIIIQNFNDITIKDKEIFDKYIKLSNTCVSEITFTNFFMWRKAYGYRYTIVDSLLVVVAFPENGDCYSYFPIGDQSTLNTVSLRKIISLLKEYFNNFNKKLLFKKITTNQVDFLNQIDDWDLIQDRDNWDYVYNSEDLIHLSGKRYDAKRNHINKFKNLFEFQFVSINEKNISECYMLNEKWCQYMDCRNSCSLTKEKNANHELLDNYHDLHLKGGLIKVNGNFEAYSVGELLNQNMSVIHIEKANIEIKGIFQIVNQQFCQNEWSNVTFVNREQDLGSAGLRKSKESYHPVFYIEKFQMVEK